MRWLSLFAVAIALLGCENAEQKDEIARLEGRLEKTIEAYKKISARYQADVKNLKIQLQMEKNKTTNLMAKIKDAAIAPDARLSMAKDALKKGQVGKAYAHLVYLKEHFPRHRVMRTVTGWLKKAKKEMRRIDKERAALQLARALKTVTVNQLRVDARKYRRKIFIRDLTCDKIELTQYVYTTGIYEINRRGFKMFAAHCCWSKEDRKALNSSDRVEIRIPRKVARKLLLRKNQKPPFKVENLYCNDSWIPGAVLKFGGQISGNTPVFVLRGVGGRIAK